MAKFRGFIAIDINVTPNILNLIKDITNEYDVGISYHKAWWRKELANCKFLIICEFLIELM